MTKIIFKLSELETIVKKEILPLLGKYKIFLFTGPLGAGKTTFIKNILKEIGVNQVITSPTFNYVNSYEINYKKNNINLNHFDLYRINNLDSFLSLGFDEYFYKTNNFCFIEWPEILEDFFINNELETQICRIELSFYENDFEKRLLIIS
ncbi:MAG: ATPase [candidate division TM6 bacterium GW2011_GWF2_28_16]|nr:MAG: ATPase [candidate division TM6 bacterium GW2011_GWF2_28_16]